jgi:hypothetical protein
MQLPMRKIQQPQQPVKQEHQGSQQLGLQQELVLQGLPWTEKQSRPRYVYELYQEYQFGIRCKRYALETWIQAKICP